MESRFIQPIVDNLINLVLLYQKSDNLDLTIGLKKDYFCHKIISPSPSARLSASQISVNPRFLPGFVPCLPPA